MIVTTVPRLAAVDDRSFDERVVPVIVTIAPRRWSALFAALRHIADR